MTPSTSISLGGRMRPGAKNRRAEAGLLLGQEPWPWLLSHILLSPAAAPKVCRGVTILMLRAREQAWPPACCPRLCCGGQLEGWEDVGRNCSRQEA